MHEGPEKKESKKPGLGMVAGAAMLSSVSMAQAQDTKDAGAQFSLDATHIAEIESEVLEGKMPLKLQLKFLEQALKKGSTYSQELADSKLTAERLSQIYKVANTVSARLTMKYAEAPKDPDLQEYFSEVDVLRNATTQFKVPRGGKNHLCNTFAVQDGAEIFEVTAFHCIQGSDNEKENGFHHPKRTEIAVKFTSKENWSARSGKNPETLPRIHTATTSENSFGRVVTSFSYGGRGEEKIDFSVALPIPANKTFLFKAKDLPFFSSIGMTEMVTFLKPYEEGLINPATKKTFSAGSSGGPVSSPGLGILGSYSATKEINDRCGKLCYALGYNSGPEVLQRAIQEERENRSDRIAEATGR